MTLENVLGMTGITGMIAIAMIGVFWFSSTVFILCIMEVRFSDSNVRVAPDTDTRLIYPGSFGIFARAPSALGRSEQQTF